MFIFKDKRFAKYAKSIKWALITGAVAWILYGLVSLWLG
nr:MAG TPA: hypothetical protein [Caudoviricetes sp.]